MKSDLNRPERSARFHSKEKKQTWKSFAMKIKSNEWSLNFDDGTRIRVRPCNCSSRNWQKTICTSRDSVARNWSSLLPDSLGTPPWTLYDLICRNHPKRWSKSTRTVSNRRTEGRGIYLKNFISVVLFEDQDLLNQRIERSTCRSSPLFFDAGLSIE